MGVVAAPAAVEIAPAPALADPVADGAAIEIVGVAVAVVQAAVFAY